MQCNLPGEVYLEITANVCTIISKIKQGNLKQEKVVVFYGLNKSSDSVSES